MIDRYLATRNTAAELGLKSAEAADMILYGARLIAAGSAALHEARTRDLHRYRDQRAEVEAVIRMLAEGALAAALEALEQAAKKVG